MRIHTQISPYVQAITDPVLDVKYSVGIKLLSIKKLSELSTC
jgi:hypothetical protein